MDKIYDVIVLGAGPAGLAAGLYAGRSRLSVLIIEKGQDSRVLTGAELDKLDDEYSTKTDVTTNDYIDEKLKRLKDVKDKIKYTLEIEVNKDEAGNWKIVNLTDADIKKIQGMY